jgi:hypothetical protein
MQDRPGLPRARPPSGPLWVHEIKHVGYRLMVWSCRTVALGIPFPLGGWQGQQLAKNGPRIQDGEFLARVEEFGRLPEGFGILDLGSLLVDALRYKGR